MDEVYKYQETITDSLKQENDKYEELERKHHLDQMISKARDYHERLVNLKRNMLIIKDRSAKLKKKADKMLVDNERTRERREMLEKHLEPVVNTKPE